MSPGKYIAGVHIVGRESRNVYSWCAHCRIQVQECILLVHPRYDANPGIYIASVPSVEWESRNVYCWLACCKR